jgi:hypothetical protein
MSVYTASIKIDATAAEAGSRLFAAAVERIRQGFDGLGGAGQQIERATQALFNFRNARDAIERAAGVGGRSDTLQRAADIDAYAREIDRLRAKYVPLAAAQQQYLSTLREIQTAQKGGALSATEAAAAIDQTKAAFASQVIAMRQAREATAAAGQSMGALRNQALTLQYTLSDIAASLGSGASPLTILMQQGPQVAQAFSKAAGGPGLMGAALAALSSPITAAVVAIGSLAVVIGSAFFRAADLSKETRVFAGELQATGRQAELTTKQLHAMVEAMRDANIAKNDARDAVSGILRTPGLDSSRVQQIAAMTPDAAVGMGTDAATAAKALADIAAQGYPAIERFALANNALDAAQLKAIKSLAQQGDQAGAVSKALDLLGARYKDLAENGMSAMDEALRNLGRGWTGFIDGIASSAPVVAIVERLATALQGAADAIKNGDIVDLMARSASLFPGMSGIKTGVDMARGAFTSRPPLSLQEQAAQQEDTVRYLRDQSATVQPFNRPEHELRIQQAEQELQRLRAQVAKTVAAPTPPTPGSAGFIGPIPVASPANQRTAQELELDRQQQELDRRLKVLRSSPVNRSVMQARLEVEDSTAWGGDINDPTSEKARAAIIAEKKARAELAAVVRDQTAAVNANVRGNMEAADAYQTSAAAGIEADARRQAGVEALTQSIDKNARAREILAEKISAEVLAGSQQLEANRNEVVNAERLAEAQKRGVGAYAETELAIKQQTATQQLSVLVQVAEKNGLIELAERLKALRGEREEQIAAIEKSNRATQHAIELRKADQDVAAAQAGASAAQIIDPSERRAAEIAIERQREFNRLMEVAKGDTQRVGELMERWDLKTASQEQARYWNDVRQTAAGVAKDVSGFLTDGVTGALANGKSGFKDFWDGALQGGKRFIARLAATFLEQRLLLPIAMQVVGGMPQAFGIAAPAGAQGAAGGSGGFQMPGMGSGGFSGITDRINMWGAENLGTAANAATSVPSAAGGWTVTGAGGPSATSLSQGTTLMQFGGAALGGITGALQLMNAKSAGGVLSGVSSLASGAMMLNPVTAPFAPLVALGGNLLGGLFGGKKPSVGPGGGADFGLDASGRARIGATSADNGYDPMVNQSAADSVGAAAVKLFDRLGLKFQGTAQDYAGSNLGYDAGVKKFTGGDTSNGKGRYDTQEQALAAALAEAVKNAKLDGVSEALTAKFRAIGSAADLEGLVNYVTQLRAVSDGFANWQEPLTQAGSAMKELQAAFDQATEAATTLGDSTDKVKASFEKQRDFLTAEFNRPLEERYLRATNQNAAADEMVRARAEADLRKQAAALGAEAVLQVEKTLAAERAQSAEQAAAQQAAAQQARLQPIVDVYTGMLNSIADGLARGVEQWKGLAKSVQAFNDNLALSNLSPLSPEERLALAQGQYSDLLGKAMSGDATAAEGVTGAAERLLTEGRGYYASSQGYSDLYGSVRAGLGGLTNFAGVTMPARLEEEARARAQAIREMMDAEMRSVRGFDAGGRHSGGLRLVGERQPELEATGPSRIWTANQIRSALTSDGSTGVIEAVNGLRADVRRLIDVILAGGRISDDQQAQVIDALKEIVAGNFLARAA